ncbi:MAG: hypothetical protein FWC27_01320, partial [Firmicutes bacterium]|nr:hypothetical protein [Bacillota bacterium]
LDRVAEEVAAHKGNVWTHIISLRREDADRLGYNNVGEWMNLLKDADCDGARSYLAGNTNSSACRRQISPHCIRLTCGNLTATAVTRNISRKHRWRTSIPCPAQRMRSIPACGGWRKSITLPSQGD